VIIIKKYANENQKLPLFGIGPFLIMVIALITLVGILMSDNVLEAGILSGVWIIVFRIVGAVLIVFGIVVWYIGAVRSGMDDNITGNILKTDGIYAWVRNPMYSGWWFFIIGISLMWHNVLLIVAIPINWCIMTIVLKNTEEKWLVDLYGEEYAEYKKSVNRCIPWKRKKHS